MDSTRCVLATIKIMQLAMSVACLVLRERAYRNHNIPDVHNTIFGGTFMGFTIVSIALLFGYFVSAPAPKEVDLLFGVFGGVSFFCCGLLSMHYPMVSEDLIYLLPAQKSKHPFFKVCTDMALMSFATALLYIFETCMLYDIWYYDREKKRRERALEEALERGRTSDDQDVLEPLSPIIQREMDQHEEGLGRLYLRSICVEVVWLSLVRWWQKRCLWRRQQREAARSAAPQAGPSSPPSPPPPPSPRPSSPSTPPPSVSKGVPRRRDTSVDSSRRSTAPVKFEDINRRPTPHPRILLTPPPDDDDDDDDDDEKD